METVEEAWAILGERCWWRSRTGDGDVAHVEAERRAACDLSLAVHAMACHLCRQAAERPESNSPAVADAYCAVRKLIKALGSR